MRAHADWEGDRPQGGQLHLVGWAEDGMRISGIWDSADDFQAFFEARVMPVVKDAGMTTEPEVHIFELYGVYAPAFGATVPTASV